MRIPALPGLSFPQEKGDCSGTLRAVYWNREDQSLLSEDQKGAGPPPHTPPPPRNPLGALSAFSPCGERGPSALSLPQLDGSARFKVGSMQCLASGARATGQLGKLCPELAELMKELWSPKSRR